MMSKSTVCLRAFCEDFPKGVCLGGHYRIIFGGKQYKLTWVKVVLAVPEAAMFAPGGVAPPVVHHHCVFHRA